MKKLEIVAYGKDNEYGIDITFHPESKTLWLRFLCFYVTICVWEEV